MTRRVTVIAGAALLALFSSAAADVIELKTGQRIEGIFREATGGKVSIEVGVLTITFEQAQVRSIQFGPLPSPSVSAQDERARAERVREELARAERVKEEQARTEQAKEELARAERAKEEQAREELAKAERAAERAREELARAERAKEELLRADRAKAVSAALASLKGLRSATQTRLAQQDYALRVKSAKVVVDRYLENAEDSSLKDAMRDATELYAYAVTSWKASLSWAGYAAYTQLGSSPLATKCPQLVRVIGESEQVNKAVSSGRTPNEVLAATGMVIANRGTPQIWACASDKVDEAETLLARIQ